MLGLGQLLEKGLRRVEFEGHGRFADGDRGRLLTHLLALQVPLESIQEQAIMRHAVPVKHLLLLLGPDAVVLVEEIQECALRFLEGRIGAGLEIAQVGEDALFELFGVFDGATKRLESECEAADDVGTGDVEEVAPVGVVSFGREGNRLLAISRATHQSTQET